MKEREQGPNDAERREAGPRSEKVDKPEIVMAHDKADDDGDENSNQTRGYKNIAGRSILTDSVVLGQTSCISGRRVGFHPVWVADAGADEQEAVSVVAGRPTPPLPLRTKLRSVACTTGLGSEQEGRLSKPRTEEASCTRLAALGRA